MVALRCHLLSTEPNHSTRIHGIGDIRNLPGTKDPPAVLLIQTGYDVKRPMMICPRWKRLVLPGTQPSLKLVVLCIAVWPGRPTYIPGQALSRLDGGTRRFRPIYLQPPVHLCIPCMAPPVGRAALDRSTLIGLKAKRCQCPARADIVCSIVRALHSICLGSILSTIDALGLLRCVISATT